jgi:hypothetical protein
MSPRSAAIPLESTASAKHWHMSCRNFARYLRDRGNRMRSTSFPTAILPAPLTAPAGYDYDLLAVRYGENISSVAPWNDLRSGAESPHSPLLILKTSVSSDGTP